MTVFLFAAGAADARPRRKGPPPPPQPPMVTAQPVAAAEPVPGSLWNEVEARRLLGLDFNARQAGDLVTVLIDERTATRLNAETAASKDSRMQASIDALFGAENAIAKAVPGSGGRLAMGISGGTSFQGAGTTGRGSSVAATLTCRVIEVLPAGNLRVWGYKQVRVNREIQYVTLQGIIRQRDIQMDNTILADRIAEARIEVTGQGVLSDKQGPGILHRVFDWVWPF